MIRTIFAGLLFLFSAVTFAAACGKALPIDHPDFCSSFKKTATCYCTSKGLPLPICQNMQALYKQMTSIYGSLEAACSRQVETTPADCVANWTCYKSGPNDKAKNCAKVCEPF
ncbi:hypothetical protein Lgra_2506 [Legionella gratiana]|uniref:Uncharacterized protein n=1 Tax=Legionella gratiana TaxID=45066 RepID=A0A378JDP2_9GAMM|nr:hypothetical protein [Legionella gratiana]KTD09271.1 hypothetical protein Lgra_2506 [Legionella gratiana]STX45476.1 Uncharacterised protein [Legionella gratiana]